MSDEPYDDNSDMESQDFKFIQRGYLESMKEYGLDSLVKAVSSNSFEEFIKYHSIGHIIKIEFMSELEAITYQGMMELAMLMGSGEDTSESDATWNRIQADKIRAQYRNYYQYLSDCYAALNRIELDGKQLHKSLSSFSSKSIDDVLHSLQSGVCTLRIGGDLKVQQSTKYTRDGDTTGLVEATSDNIRGAGSYFVVDDTEQIICYDDEFAYLVAKFSYQMLARGVSELDMPLLLAPLTNITREDTDAVRYDYLVDRSQQMRQYIIDAYNQMKTNFGQREYCQDNAEWGD